ncbi:MAG: hypothetical protein NUV90_02570 [Candidatus Parcubacteria bacterium]|nr:hypothetical protein [Candidatus Parcubacteria bacterium]
MLKLWKTSTAIFLLQLLGFAISYDFVDKGNVDTAKVVTSVIASGIAAAAVLFAIAEDRIDKEVGSLTIFLLAFGAAVIELPRGLIPVWDTVVVVVACLCLIIAVMLERAEGESVAGCFFTTIPGIGTIVGGVILLYRLFCRRHRRQISAM